MKERPILFNAPMVRAILAGTKTQTRRVVNPQPVELPDFNRGRLSYNVRGSVYRAWNPAVMVPSCPYGQPGDRLWVRETFGHFERNDQLKPGCEIFYRADGEGPHLEPWRPSIHLPRWASRILLEITRVRVERLHEISRGDAMAEGCPFPNMADGDDPRQWYAGLWEQINGPGSWIANAWVWVVEFKRVTP